MPPTTPARASGADIAEVIRDAGHEAIVLGAELNRPDDDYPIFAKLVGDAIAAGRAERAVLICGSGAGVTVAANKLPACARASPTTSTPPIRWSSTTAAT